MNADAFVMNKVEFAYSGIDEAFPEVDPGVAPAGYRVLVQLRQPKAKTKGGILLPGAAKDTETWNTQVAKVVAIGPVAFRDRKTNQQWVEGAWAIPGDFVRIPKHGGDRWSIRIGTGEDAEEVLFVMFHDLDILGKVTGDPLAMKAYL